MTTDAAERYLRYVDEAFSGDHAWAQVNATQALTHAVLAVAEELRTANLIAAANRFGAYTPSNVNDDILARLGGLARTTGEA